MHMTPELHALAAELVANGKTVISVRQAVQGERISTWPDRGGVSFKELTPKASAQLGKLLTDLPKEISLTTPEDLGKDYSASDLSGTIAVTCDYVTTWPSGFQGQINRDVLEANYLPTEGQEMGEPGKYVSYPATHRQEA